MTLNDSAADAALVSTTDGGESGWQGYASADERPPLGSRLVLSSSFAAAFTLFLGWRRRSGRGLPEAIGVRDLLLIAGASFKLGRLITKSKVAAPLRAPFTELQGEGDAPGEVDEKPRGSGPREAIGELLTCPFCLGVWTASGLAAGLVMVPRETRLIASILTTVGISDFLQGAYAALEKSSSVSS